MHSYAQYGEDLVLWSGLSDVRAGFYIDVGASDPELDSVTKLFYDEGWSGINIEPRLDAWERLNSDRARDINLRIAASRSEGAVELHEIPEQPGLTTSRPEVLRADFEVRRSTVPGRPLRDICAEQVRGDIHFLKIDVEGTERAVLEGCDFTRFRPWILAIEATWPCTYEPSHEEWEDIVLNAGYELALFHSINRYYVAAEHSERIPRIRAPLEEGGTAAEKCSFPS